ncbi:MAG: hypothetical protein CSA76_06130 [Spirochaetales bacterium]|nr:MAG: hypothetical protein CSA76_06130 [Spirochaetales bacterium]
MFILIDDRSLDNLTNGRQKVKRGRENSVKAAPARRRFARRTGTGRRESAGPNHLKKVNVPGINVAVLNAAGST